MSYFRNTSIELIPDLVNPESFDSPSQGIKPDIAVDIRTTATSIPFFVVVLSVNFNIEFSICIH
jgi:hypothetical protein